MKKPQATIGSVCTGLSLAIEDQARRVGGMNSFATDTTALERGGKAYHYEPGINPSCHDLRGQ